MTAVLTHLFPAAAGRLMGQALESQTPKMDVEPSPSGAALVEQNHISNGILNGDEVPDRGSDTSNIVEATNGEKYDTNFQPDDDDSEDELAAKTNITSRKRTNQDSFEDNKLLNADESAAEESAQSGESSSESEIQWEGESEEGLEVEADVAISNQCFFCGQDEEHDPSDEFEMYLSCCDCENHAHRQCAHEAQSLDQNEDGDSWRCPNCVENDIEPESGATAEIGQQQSSAPRFARDLFPMQRGTARPGSHSMFNTLILDDDPMDGSRSLRKRKASDPADDPEASTSFHPDHAKRRRRTISDANKSGSVPLLRNHDNPTPVALDGVNDLPVRPRSARTRAIRQQQHKDPLIEFSSRTPFELIAVIRIPPEKLRDLDNEKRRRRRRERERERRLRAQQHLKHSEISHFPALPPSSLILPRISEAEEFKVKPYGGILAEEDSDTIKTFPQGDDLRKFEDARQRAEEECKRKEQAALLRTDSRSNHANANKTQGPPSKVKCVNFSGYEIDTWHTAPYPEEYTHNRVLYICEFCLKYMHSDFVAWRHKLKCPAKHPPGDEIYRDGQISFFEVDGRKNPVYCQNLCLLAKLFLGSKTLYYDVEPFLFYVMTENDEHGCHFVGYFSKEKRPSSLNNVSCILVLPIHQRRGFGHLLIDFSYLLTRVEQKTGSPEKPLSDMGLVSYRSYWRLVMCQHLIEEKEDLSIMDLSEKTGMTPDDVVCALEGLRALVMDPTSKTYALRLDKAYFKEYIKNYEAKNYVKLTPDALIWVPYVMGRDNTHYESGAPLHTVAQRDEDNDSSPPEEGVQQLASRGISHMDDALDKEDSASGPSNDPSPTEGYMPSKEHLDSTTAMPKRPATGQRKGSQSPLRPSFNEGSAKSASPIPPSRFEVWPPIPGTRKVGRPLKRPSAGRRGTSLANVSTSVNGDSLGGRSSRPTLSTNRILRSGLSNSVTANLGQNAEGNDDLQSPTEMRAATMAGRSQGEDVEMHDAEE